MPMPLSIRDHNWTEFTSSLLLNSKFVLDEEFPHELKVAH